MLGRIPPKKANRKLTSPNASRRYPYFRKDYDGWQYPLYFRQHGYCFFDRATPPPTFETPREGQSFFSWSPLKSAKTITCWPIRKAADSTGFRKLRPSGQEDPAHGTFPKRTFGTRHQLSPGHRPSHDVYTGEDDETTESVSPALSAYLGSSENDPLILRRPTTGLKSGWNENRAAALFYFSHRESYGQRKVRYLRRSAPSGRIEFRDGRSSPRRQS